MNEFIKKILNEICKEEQIKYTNLCNDYITLIERDGKYGYINGSHIGDNSYMSVLLADDKYAMYEALRHANVPVIEYKLIWDRRNKKDHDTIEKKLKEIKEYYYAHGNHIVLKPNRGFGGRMVYNIENESQIEPVFKELLNATDSIVVNPYYEAKTEHRIVLFNGEPRLGYAKVKGEGQWQFNLSKGGMPVKIKPIELEERLNKIAKLASKTVGGCFLCVDIFEEYDGKLEVLEINGSVLLDDYVDKYPEEYDKVKQIYKDAILETLKK